jgi:hypothetical protein
VELVLLDLDVKNNNANATGLSAGLFGEEPWSLVMIRTRDTFNYNKVEVGFLWLFVWNKQPKRQCGFSSSNH